VKNGVPWATVFADELPWEGEIPNDWSLGLGIIFAEFKGAKFNWRTMKYEQPKP
jgi:hypothetical protein